MDSGNVFERKRIEEKWGMGALTSLVLEILLETI